MKPGRSWKIGVALAVAGCALVPACRSRKPVEVNAIVPTFTANRLRVPLNSAMEVTYTWTVEPSAKRLNQEYRALAHFLDAHKVILFTDDHLPVPPPSAWEPGKTYSYTRTVFVPAFPYVGEGSVVMGLYPEGKGERVPLKGEDLGMREYKAAKIEFLPQTENTFLVFKEGWYGPESNPANPGLERTWTKKEALVSFKNPKKDVIVYLEADTNSKAFPEQPVLTVSVGGKTGLTIPIENSEVFQRKIRFKAGELGGGDWADLRLSMNQSFVPKAKGINQDDRELGLMVYHLYVAEADRLGSTVPGVVEAGPVTLPSPSPSPGAKGTTPKTPVKPAPAKPATSTKHP